MNIQVSVRRLVALLNTGMEERKALFMTVMNAQMGECPSLTMLKHLEVLLPFYRERRGIWFDGAICAQDEKFATPVGHTMSDNSQMHTTVLYVRFDSSVHEVAQTTV